MKTIILWINYFIELFILLFNKPKSKHIDVSKMGVNSFYNDDRFGSYTSQAAEIHNNLKIKYQRVLYVWDDNTQPSKESPINFDHLDKLIASQQENAKLLVVVYGVPDWAALNGNNIYEEMFRQLCIRYADNPRVEGYQIWNEPDMETDFNRKMDFIHNPEKYFSLLKDCSKISRMINKEKIVTNAATRSISQEFPRIFKYNKTLIDNGALELVDVYSIHWYGDQWEKLYRPNSGDRIIDFLNRIEIPIWATESGIEGLEQLTYCSKTWPFLLKKIKKLDRIYHYIYHEASDSRIQFGMKAFIDGELDVSDLFVYLLNKERL